MTTVEQAVARLRDRLADHGGDVNNPTLWKTDDSGALWKNEELVYYIQAAQIEFCRRRLIQDSLSPICSVSITAGTASYSIDPSIIQIDKVSISGSRAVVNRFYSTDNLEQLYPYPEWPNAVYYSHDFDYHQLVFYPVPTEDGVANLMVSRLPINQLEWSNNSNVLEVDDLYFEDILLYASYLAFSKRDAETKNLEAANVAAERFRSRVGPPINPRSNDARRELGNVTRSVTTYY